MIKLSKMKGQRLIDIHGWLGVLLGLFLYIVVLSGAVVVFSHEIGVWSVSGPKVGLGLDGKIDQRLKELSDNLPEQYKDEISIRPNALGELVVFFHTHTKDANNVLSERGVRYVLDPDTLAILSEDQGFIDDIPLEPTGFLESFLLELHINLHIPSPIGLYLTGLLGLILLVSTISGLMIHRHLIKDMFLSPRLHTRLLNSRDRHNLAGTWSIIFSIIVAFTGAFFSFATTLGLPVLAITAFGGDQQKAMIAVFGEAPIPNTTLAPFVGLETIISQSKHDDIGGSLPISIDITHLGKADALVNTVHAPYDTTLFFTTHTFNGVTGDYVGEKYVVGEQASIGNTFVGVMGVLHFGYFAGLFSRIIWFSLGMATCYVIISGVELWLQRRQKSGPLPQLSRLVAAVTYGLPIAMITAAMGFIFAYSNHSPYIETVTVYSFIFGTIISFVVGFLLPMNSNGKQPLQYLLALSLIALPFIRALCSHEYTSSFAVTAMDTSLIAGGLIIIVLSIQKHTVNIAEVNKH